MFKKLFKKLKKSKKKGVINVENVDMDWKKVVKKGAEAGIPAALGALGVTQTIDMSNTESIVSSLGAAVAGFLFGMIKNWLKHR